MKEVLARNQDGWDVKIFALFRRVIIYIKFPLSLPTNCLVLDDIGNKYTKENKVIFNTWYFPR